MNRIKRKLTTSLSESNCYEAIRPQTLEIQNLPSEFRTRLLNSLMRRELPIAGLIIRGILNE